MASPIYRQITGPTPEELDAARAYQAESGFFHLGYQGAHDFALINFRCYEKLLFSGKLASLITATRQRYELIDNVTLYSGHGNGTGTTGALSHAEFSRFKNIKWRYPGITSTSQVRVVAEDCALKRRNHPILLEFRLKSEFRLFPMDTLGQGHEMEFLIPPTECVIMDAAVISIRDAPNVLHLVLQPFR